MSLRLAGMIAAFVAGSLLAPGRARAALPCDADIDGDQEVEVDDFLAVLAAWGSCPNPGPCPADITHDGVVGVDDFLEVLEWWGSYLFDYGPALEDPEAEQIGLEMQGPGGALLVPPDDYARIVQDLGVIRAFEPALAGEAHTPAWNPDELLVALVSGAPLDEYSCLSDVYQVVNEQLISQSLNLWLLTFAGNLNVEALALIYEQAPEVNYAEPNSLIGGQNFWTPSPQGGGIWQWDVDDGFLDCFDGCDCHRSYVFQTDAAGHVHLVSYQEFGQPWCEF